MSMSSHYIKFWNKRRIKLFLNFWYSWSSWKVTNEETYSIKYKGIRMFNTLYEYLNLIIFVFNAWTFDPIQSENIRSHSMHIFSPPFIGKYFTSIHWEIFHFHSILREISSSFNALSNQHLRSKISSQKHLFASWHCLIQCLHWESTCQQS